MSPFEAIAVAVTNCPLGILLGRLSLTLKEALPAPSVKTSLFWPLNVFPSLSSSGWEKNITV